jgi:hypothetical protein
MSRENFLWGAPRIHGELPKLGFDVSQATVSRYMPPWNRPPSQGWRTFLRNQAAGVGIIGLARRAGYQISFALSSPAGSSGLSGTPPGCGMTSVPRSPRHSALCNLGHLV